MSGLLGGLLHPLTTPAHALALLALGLLVGQQRGAARRVSTTAFAAGLIAGLAAIASALGPTAADVVVLVVAALAGLLVALARPLPLVAGVPLMALSGAALGLDSPPQATSVTVAIAMLIGTGLGACLAFAVVATCAGRLAAAWQRIGMRILGSWIAASALLVLALRFARGQLL